MHLPPGGDFLKAQHVLWSVGFAMLLESIFLQLDFSLYGIPSIIFGGFHLHHWMLGVVLVLIGVFVDE